MLLRDVMENVTFIIHIQEHPHNLSMDNSQKKIVALFLVPPLVRITELGCDKKKFKPEKFMCIKSEVHGIQTVVVQQKCKFEK